MSEPSKIIHLEQATRFVAPTPEEVHLWCAKIGLPEIQGQIFMDFYESKNWHVGKTKMSSWRSALSGWKHRWHERQSERKHPHSEAFLILRHADLKRIEARILHLRGRNGSTGWPAEDLSEIANLKRRRSELKSILGFLA